MLSFIAKVSEFFRMARLGTNIENFDRSASRYVIPKYQREYKWSEEKVITLIDDINNRDKFLGNIILDKKDSCYEIVDGQQRITTVYLILIALFNLLQTAVSDHPNLEQQNILQYLQKNADDVLWNESIGHFMRIGQNQIDITISESLDVYHQGDKFALIFKTICDRIQSIVDKSSFVHKLLESQFLILISENLGHTTSIEQIFLDINFKSQLLDVEDIFKGYCFKNYWPDFHDDLKQQWVELKKNSREFIKFGYSDFSEFLYHYMLSRPESKEIPQNLSPGGKHCLDGKNADETKAILDDMVSYSKNITQFLVSLDSNIYFFQDICPDFSRYVNTREQDVLKDMCKAIIYNKAAQYHKFPLLMVIHSLKGDRLFSQSITRDELKRFITNYYVYSFLFINDSKRKQKSSIDHTIIDLLRNSSPDKHSLIVRAIKEMRSRYASDYQTPDMFNLDNSYALYSITDLYKCSDNFIPRLYSSESNYTQEHLVVHDNRKKKVTWVEDGNRFDFELADVPDISAYKRSMINFIILKSETNGSMGRNDIVEKIRFLEIEYAGRLPRHVSLFINSIKSMESFDALLRLKGQAASQAVIIAQYKAFVTQYFSEDNRLSLALRIKELFANTFVNSPSA